MIQTISDEENVPVRSQVEIDLVTEDYKQFDAWCVSQDIYIQSFTNGLYLRSDDYYFLYAGSFNTDQLKWEAFPNKNFADNGFREFRYNGKALTAHQGQSLVTLEEVLPDDHEEKAYQQWNLHFP